MKLTVLKGQSEVQDCGIQSSSHRAPSFDVPNCSALLESAETLESIEAYIQELMAALRYFVELGSSDRPRDFADVKRTLSNAHTLLKSSVPTLPRLQELAVELRALATERATWIASVSKLDERMAFPVDLGPPQKEQDEPRRTDMILSKIKRQLPNSSTNRQPGLSTDPISAQEEQKEQDRLRPSTDNQPSLSADPCPTPREENEQKRVDLVLSEIEVLLGIPSTHIKAASPIAPHPTKREVDPIPTEAERREQANATAALAEIRDFTPRPTIESKAVPLGAPISQPEWIGLKTSDPVSYEVEALLGKETISIFSEIEAFLATKG